MGLLKSEQGQFDWIFYDWDLGDIPPHEFLDRVRHDGAGQRAAILMMTRNRERYIVHEALRAGADDYLVKPFTLSILLLKMRRMGALRERRRHERMTLDDNDDMCLRFDNGEETPARLVTVSRVGCLVRAPRSLSRYAHVYDTSTISLQAGEEELSSERRADPYRNRPRESRLQRARARRLFLQALDNRAFQASGAVPGPLRSTPTNRLLGPHPR